MVGGGWSDKTKLILISTLVEVVVEVEVELGKNRGGVIRSQESIQTSETERKCSFNCRGLVLHDCPYRFWWGEARSPPRGG